MPSFIQSNFNGEWSPLMWGRVEMARYATALRRMLNFMPTPTGGARKRPGTDHLGSVMNSAQKSRLDSFTFSNDQAYLFEFGEEIVRFWRDGLLLVDTEATPYLEAEIFNIRMTATNDVVYIAHGNHWPRELSRDSDTDWSVSELVLENQPFSDLNRTDISLSSSALTGNVSLTSSADHFTASMVGSSFRLEHNELRNVDETTISATAAPASILDLSLDYNAGQKVGQNGNFYTCIANYVSSTDYVSGNDDVTDYPLFFAPGIVAKTVEGDAVEYEIRGEWTVRTEGRWDGEWLIQESDDDGSTWTTRYSMSSTAGSDNYIREGNEEENPLRIRLVLSSGTSNNALVTFTRQEVRRSGEAKVTAFVSATEVTATVEKDIFSTASTKLWAENEWNPRKGYPSKVFFKGDRLCFASTRAEGQAVWGSESDNWPNFGRSLINDSAPFKDVLRTGNQDPIRWVSEQSVTLLGLSSQIRNLTREDGSGILAPGKNDSSRQAGRGAADLDAVEVDDFTFYAQAGKRIIRGLSNDYERGVFAAPDMTREAEHVTRGGVIQMAFQLNRVSTLYAVTGSGQCACLVFDPEIEKLGWYRIETQGGLIESVAVLPTTGEEDEVYFVVKRVINGQTVRYIERLRNDQVRVQDDGMQDDMFYVDCGATVTGVDLTEITGANHLEGQTVQVLADGDFIGERQVVGGRFDIPSSSKVSYGLKILAQLWQMPLEGILANGSTSGDKKRVTEAVVDVLNSMGLKAKISPDDPNEAQDLTPRRSDDALDSAERLYNGKAEVRIPLPRSFDDQVFYEADEPYGVFIRNIITKWEKT